MASTMKEQITGGLVYLVDDDASVRSGLTRLMRSHDLEVVAFASARDFLNYHPPVIERPCCMVVDMRMPQMNGMELMDELEKTGCNYPFIFLTAHGDIPLSVRAMKKGAVDFLPKPCSQEELMTAVFEGLKADQARSRSLREFSKLRRRFDTLSPREYEVMRYVIGGMLNKQIAFSLGISEKTVKVHRARVMTRLEVDSVADLVRLTEKASIAPAH